MLSKIILTLLVIVGAVFILRARQTVKKPSTATQSPEMSDHQKLMKQLTYSVVIFSLLSGTVMYYFSWQDDHRLYQIKIVNPQTSKEEVYKAYKKNLKGRQFTTLTGLKIRASELERLEFKEIE